jgi:hypothetical protein
MKRYKALKVLGIIILIWYVATHGIPVNPIATPAPRALATTTPPPGVTDCHTGITPEAADQLSELDLFNARAWIMRECGGVPIHDITQATLDCENAIAAQYPTDQWSRDMYDRQLTCPGEPVVTPSEGSPTWHQR